MPPTKALRALAVDPSQPVPAAHQWIATTPSRIAPDGYSWMQAVCWAYHRGSYQPARGHGPRLIGETTLRVARELARLSPCRPGVDYLVRVLKVSKRTVQYHLGILRETGLLAYRVKGTRLAGEGSRASEFVWTIPASFDVDLHLVTRPCDRYIRSLRGIADEGRRLMKRLAKMARDIMRRSPRRRSVNSSAEHPSRKTRCTPMEGSSNRSSTAGVTPSPPETKLDRATGRSVTPSKPKGLRQLNTVARRYQLARELTQQVDWLRSSSIPRVAWVAREVADAGWTIEEVRAWLHLRGGTTRVRRATGFLAILLSHASGTLDTPAKRSTAVARWRDAEETARRTRIRQERARAERYDCEWRAPRSMAVRRMVAHALAPKPDPQQKVAALPNLGGPQNLTGEELEVMRETARAEYMQGETALVTSAVNAFGCHVAESMYGRELVERSLRLSRHTSHMSLARR